DGKGIDADKIAQSAIAKGFITIADADRLTQGEKLDLITIPGFSTEGNVTEISGRGVGMDAVKNSIEKVGGKLEILTQVGTGTTFRITFPSRLELEPSRIQDVS
ncbi:MAG: ATP-binding protein, partial [Bdellovibrionales bacterium]